MDTLSKVICNSGLPLDKLLPDTRRKRVKKYKKAKDGSLEKIPLGENTRDNLTQEEV